MSTDTLEIIELDESMLDEIVCEVDKNKPATHWIRHGESGHFICQSHAEHANISLAAALEHGSAFSVMVCDVEPCSGEDYSPDQISVRPL